MRKRYKLLDEAGKKQNKKLTSYHDFFERNNLIAFYR